LVGNGLEQFVGNYTIHRVLTTRFSSAIQFGIRNPRDKNKAKSPWTTTVWSLGFISPLKMIELPILKHLVYL